PGIGEIALAYSQAFLIIGVVGVLLFFALYRLTLKRFEVLNQEIDKVLKGELAQVTNEFKAPEFNHLWDVINAAMQRIPRSGSDGDFSTDDGSGSFSLEEITSSYQSLAEVAGVGICVVDSDKKI